MMQTRLVNVKDYERIKGWWEARNKTPFVPPECLPETAMIVDDVAAGFLFLTNSKTALLEFVTTNPAAASEQRAEALELLIKAVLKWCDQISIKMLWSFHSESDLRDTMTRHGLPFVEAGMNCHCRLSAGAKTVDG